MSDLTSNRALDNARIDGRVCQGEWTYTGLTRLWFCDCEATHPRECPRDCQTESEERADELRSDRASDARDENRGRK